MKLHCQISTWKENVTIFRFCFRSLSGWSFSTTRKTPLDENRRAFARVGFEGGLGPLYRGSAGKKLNWRDFPLVSKLALWLYFVVVAKTAATATTETALCVVCALSLLCCVLCVPLAGCCANCSIQTLSVKQRKKNPQFLLNRAYIFVLY